MGDRSDAFLANGNPMVVYRDDAITGLPQTGISAVATDTLGHASWATRKDLLVSTDIGWGWAPDPNPNNPYHGTNIVENPSMAPFDGNWYLFFSGGKWDANAFAGEQENYATGIALCGSTPLPSSRCKPLIDVNRPYFGWSARPGAHPIQNLPGDHANPGGMSVYKSLNEVRAVWHWRDYTTNPIGLRRSRNSTIHLDGDGYFRVG